MYRLKNWHLEMTTNGFIAWGYCYDNPEFFQGDYIRTSDIVKLEAEDNENEMRLFTTSGSCYILGYADINEIGLEVTEKVLKSRDIAFDLHKCVALREDRVEGIKKKLFQVLKPNELYVTMAGWIGILEAYFKTEENTIVPMSVKAHIGTF